MLDRELKIYLSDVESYLRNLNTVERVDIIEEIKSNIYDMQSNENLNNNQIIQRLGEPKELAKSYFSENIQKQGKKLKIINIINIINFYSATSLLTLIVVPVLGVFSIVFPIASLISAGSGFLIFIDTFLNIGIRNYIDVNIVGLELNGFLKLLVCLGISIFFYFIGKISWIGLIKYIKTFIILKNKIEN